MLQVYVQLLTHTLSTYYYNLAGVALLIPMPHDTASRPSSPTHRPPRASPTLVLPQGTPRISWSNISSAFLQKLCMARMSSLLLVRLLCAASAQASALRDKPRRYRWTCWMAYSASLSPLERPCGIGGVCGIC